jgi:hypothetical protein
MHMLATWLYHFSPIVTLPSPGSMPASIAHASRATAADSNRWTRSWVSISVAHQKAWRVGVYAFPFIVLEITFHVLHTRAGDRLRGSTVPAFVRVKKKALLFDGLFV